MPGIENIETLWDFILLMIQGGSIVFVWLGLFQFIANHQEMIKGKLYEDNRDTEPKFFGIYAGTIVRNLMYAFLISCAIYTSYRLGAFGEF